MRRLFVKAAYRVCGCGPDSTHTGWDPVTNSLDRSNECSDSINGREFLDNLGNYQLHSMQLVILAFLEVIK
jgi:hypothetical protein